AVIRHCSPCSCFPSPCIPLFTALTPAWILEPSLVRALPSLLSRSMSTYDTILSSSPSALLARCLCSSARPTIYSSPSLTRLLLSNRTANLPKIQFFFHLVSQVRK